MKIESTYLTSGNDMLIVRKDLATAIGLNEAIILNQIHYWIQKNQNERHFKDGKYWMYETYEGWHEQIPFLSISTIKRTMKSLKDKQLIETQNFNKKNWDRTVWYSVNYEKIDESVDKMRECQIDTTKNVSMTQSLMSDWTSQKDQVDPTNTIDYTENTTKTTSEITKELCIDDAPRIDDLGIYMFHVRRTVMNSERIISKDEVIEAMEYFFRQYTVHKGESHIKLKKETIESIGEKLDTFADDLKDMIDRYFSTDFREDYCSLPHFASDNILELKAYETGALGPALQLSYA